MYPIIRRRHHWEVPEHFTSDTPYAGHFWRNLLEGPEGWFAMSYPLDMHEASNNLVVEAELPGFSREQIHLSIDDNVLHLRAERESTEPPGFRHITERKLNLVTRHIRLPVAVDESKAEARMVNGVLRVEAPKKKTSPGKEIPIE
jgi:HSP20 family protein